MSVHINKHKMTEWLVCIGSFLLLIHFGFSLITWFMFEGLAIWSSYCDNYWERDWLTSLHAIPAVVLFAASLTAFVFANKNVRKALIVLLLTLAMSVLCFIYETSNHLCQMRSSVQHIGSVYSVFSLGYQEHYFTWWWYKSVIPYFGDEDFLSQKVQESTRPTRDYLKAAPEDLQWFCDAKFGMFVCWGPVTLTGKEIGWSRGEPAWGHRPGVLGGKGETPIEVYDNLYKKWKPDKFDARKWVRVAKDAGAKYMIFLVKHHDGFCLYDTKLTDYKSTAPESAWQVDVMKHIADACHEAGLKLIVYYSQPDWYHPDYLGERHDRYITYLHGQIRELLTNYGRIDGLWFDGARPAGRQYPNFDYGGPALWGAKELFKMARSLQPHLIINNRCNLPGDFDTPEQRIGKFRTDRPWESCITLGTQWAWKPDDKLKSLKECIDILVRCVGGGGNLALNTNPMPDGEIEPRQAERFREIGQWLGKYGESIYATSGGPFKPGPWGASTHKQKIIYVHILKWENDKIILPAIKQKIVGSFLFAGGKVQVQQNKTGIVISVHPADRHKLDTIIVLQTDTPI